jgi:3-deoxy-7-phosphoheptulonate synthase
MWTYLIDDLRIANMKPLIPPAILLEELPATEAIAAHISASREAVGHVVKGNDQRLLVIAGPCSIHDVEAANEYATRLKALATELEEHLLIVMRVYFEKPRTTVGWKGLINDPGLDNSFKINKGLHLARGLLIDLADMGLPVGCEFLDTITPQFIADLVCWGAIGARTTESQVHRELASGLSVPVGFKNATNGSIRVAVDAIQAASHPHQFLSVTKQSVAAIVVTTGNDSCHLILRGSTSGPNYEREAVQQCADMLEAAGLRRTLLVDCSHGNSRKDYGRQAVVAREVSRQLVEDEDCPIFGVMVESHLVPGRQNVDKPEALTYGQSITDACMGWEQSVEVLHQLAEAVAVRTKTRDCR